MVAGPSKTYIVLDVEKLFRFLLTLYVNLVMCCIGYTNISLLKKLSVFKSLNTLKMSEVTPLNWTDENSTLFG